MAQSFTKVLVSAARAGARASRRYEATQRREESARLRYQKASHSQFLKIEKENLKIAKQEYLESRLTEVEELTNEDREKFTYLNSETINEALKINNALNFETLKPQYLPPSEDPPSELLVFPSEPSELSFLENHRKMPFWGYFFVPVKQRWLDNVEKSKSDYQMAILQWKMDIKEKEGIIERYKLKLKEERRKYELEFINKCREVEDFKHIYFSGDEEAISAYTGIILEKSNYFVDWDRDFKIAYNKDSNELLVDFKFPTIEIIPTILEYRYIKTKDIIEEKYRKKIDIDRCYKNLITSIAIRTIHEILESDLSNAIAVVIFNGYVETINKTNGNAISPTLLSISVTKREFEQINLSRIEPINCVKGLSAKISSSPSEFIPIKPIKEFSMVDKRYVPEEDILSSLDHRPNLMELNPYEFENLVTNLFSRMGLDTKQTRSSKDGGIDAVAFDLRPILGGKIVIQAKRYKNIVGVSAVRDLYGTMLNEGATKGLLVTTSWYGPDAYEFSKNKPIELIDGSGLLYLLHEAGIEAKIIMPLEI